MNTIKLPINKVLGSPDVKAFPKTQFDKIKEIIDALNAIISGTGTIALFKSTEVDTAKIAPITAGSGTSIQSPVISGSAYVSPTVLTTAQSGAVCMFNAIAGNVFTLPAATSANKGVTFTFIQTATVTSNAATIQGATSSDLFVVGSGITQIKGTATPTVAYYSPNGSSNYKVSGNGTTTGGIIGDRYTVTCLGLNQWLVDGRQSASGTVATPFAG